MDTRMREAPPRSMTKASRVYWLSLALFVGLQIADLVTTNHALTIPGIWEANPLMALMQAKLGAAWWLPKLAVVAYLCVAASFTGLKQRFGESRVDLMAYGRTQWS